MRTSVISSKVECKLYRTEGNEEARLELGDWEGHMMTAANSCVCLKLINYS